MFDRPMWQGRRQPWLSKGRRLGSLEALAEQLQSAISDTVALTEGLLGTSSSSSGLGSSVMHAPGGPCE